MATYYRGNVNWSVHPDLEEARRLLEAEADRRGSHLFVTSANDGQHGGRTRHNNINKIKPEGNAFDFEKKPFKNKSDVLTIIGKGNKSAAEKTFDVVPYKWGFHLERDPKG